MKLNKNTKEINMKLLAEFLQEKFGENKTEIAFTIEEYMQYANVKDKTEKEVFPELKEKVERLLNYSITLGVTGDVYTDIYTDMSFVRFIPVVAVMWVDAQFEIKTSDETTDIRHLNEHWLVDCVTKGE